jgi:hypothetical protein
MFSSVKELLTRRRTARKKLHKVRGSDVVVVSYAKSGRTWLNAMISRLYHVRYGTPATQLINHDNFQRFNPAIPSVFFNHALGGLEKTDNVKLYLDRKVILLVRDPRDVAVSLWFHFAKRATAGERTIHGIPAGVTELSPRDFILREEVGLPSVVAFLERWLRNLELVPRSLLIRYEDLRAQPTAALKQVMDFVGGNFSEDEIAAAVAFCEFENMQKLERTGFFETKKLAPGDPDDSDSFKVRRGKVGGYRDYLSPEEVAETGALLASRLPPELGYS